MLAPSFCDAHSYATEKLGWFRGFLRLENGVPGHDTFRRFWKLSAPARLNSVFMEWVDEIGELFETKFSDRDMRFKTYGATQKGHGCVAKRTCRQTDYIEWFADGDKWAGLRSVIMVDTECLRQKTGETTTDRRVFISSLPVDPKRALELAVSHWDIENPLHWTLDMIFDEDHSRARSGFAAENLAILRHLEFNLIRAALR